jgi:peptidoglycan/xylan/chitin deacetylase (PgdA/CDA1 family)
MRASLMGLGRQCANKNSCIWRAHSILSAARIPYLIRTWRKALGLQPFTIIMYHSVSTPSDDFTLSPDALRGQLRFIRDRYSVARLAEINSRLVPGEPERYVALTFDDAFEDFYEHAYPILEELLLPCTVFVPTGYIGRSSEWDEGTSTRRRKIMDCNRLRELAGSALIDFGSHSVDHLNMRCLKPDQMRCQAVDSKHALEDLLGRQIISFAYPYGTMDHFSRATRSVLETAGYQIAVTARWGTMNRLSNLLELRRIAFKQSDSNLDLYAKIEGEYDWFAIKEHGGFLARRLAALASERSPKGIHRSASDK